MIEASKTDSHIVDIDNANIDTSNATISNYLCLKTYRGTYLYARTKTKEFHSGIMSYNGTIYIHIYNIYHHTHIVTSIYKYQT